MIVFTIHLGLFFCRISCAPIVVVLLFSGCTTVSDALEDVPVKERLFLNTSREKVFQATVQYFQEEGFNIIASDFSGGVLSADLASPEPLPEEQAEKGRFAPSAGEIILGVLGIILAIGFLFLVVKAVLEQQNNVGGQTPYLQDNRMSGGTMAQDESLHYYRYIFTLSFITDTPTTVRLHTSIVRERYERGAVVSSEKLKGTRFIPKLYSEISSRLSTP